MSDLSVGASYGRLLAGIVRDFGVRRDAAASIVARVGHWQTTCDCGTLYGPDGNCPTCDPAEPEDEPGSERDEANCERAFQAWRVSGEAPRIDPKAAPDYDPADDSPCVSYQARCWDAMVAFKAGWAARARAAAPEGEPDVAPEECVESEERECDCTRCLAALAEADRHGAAYKARESAPEGEPQGEESRS